MTDYQFAEKSDRQVLLVPGGGKLWASTGDARHGGTARLRRRHRPAPEPRRHAGGLRAGGRTLGAALAGGAAEEARQLTSGAEPGLTNGLAEFIAQEELDRDRGFWWSPDGARIAFIRADSRHITDYTIVHQGKDEVDNEPHRYPFAGEPNALLQLGVVDSTTGATTWMDIGADTDIYIARVGWRPDGVLTGADALARPAHAPAVDVRCGRERRRSSSKSARNPGSTSRAIPHSSSRAGSSG